MNHTEFFKQLKNSEIATTYLFTGNEHFVCASALSQLEKAIIDPTLRELNYAILEAPTADQIVQACQTIPFCAERRMVVVKDFSPLVAGGSSEGEDEIIAYLKEPSETCVLVFISPSVDNRKKLPKALSKFASVVEFNVLTCAEAQKWIAQYLKRENVFISSEDAAFLCEYSSTTPSMLATELDKLVCYVKNSAVTRQDILDIVTPQADFNVFNMIDLILAKNSAAACKQLSTMLTLREDPIKILGAISRQFALMLAFTQFEKAKTSKAEVIKILEIRDFVYPKLASACRKKSVEQIKHAVDICAQADVDLKTGKQFDNSALHKLVIELCKI